MFNGQYPMLSIGLNVQECDATEDDKGPSAGNIIITIIFLIHLKHSSLITDYSLTGQ